MEYEVVYAADSGGGYEWSEVRLFKGPNGEYAVFWTSGCSCNDYESELSYRGGPESLEWHFDRNRAHKQFRQGLENYNFTVAQAFDHYDKMLIASRAAWPPPGRKP